MFLDHLRQLEPIEIRHADVDQDDRNLVAQDLFQGLAARRRLDQILAEIAQDDLIAQQLGRLVIDQQNIDRK